MKKITMLLLFLCAVSSASDAEKRHAAVYMVGEEPAAALGSHAVLGAELAKAISGSDEYVAVDRTEAIRERMEGEHEYQRSGAVDDSQIKDLGKQLGVQYLCIASVSEIAGGKFFLEARLVDVVTAQVIKIASARSGGDGLHYAAQRVARELVPGVKTEVDARHSPTNTRFNAEIHTGYHTATGDYSVSGVGVWGGATGFLRADRFHRMGLSVGISGLYGFGSDSDDNADYDVTHTYVTSFFTGIYRAGYRTRYADVSFSVNVSLYNSVKTDAYVYADDWPDDRRDTSWTQKPDMDVAYSIDASGRYDYIGAGVGRMLSDDVTTVYVSGYIPVGARVDIIPAVTVQFGDETTFIFSVGADILF